MTPRLKPTNSEWKIGAINGAVAAMAANIVGRVVGPSLAPATAYGVGRATSFLLTFEERRLSIGKVIARLDQTKVVLLFARMTFLPQVGRHHNVKDSNQYRPDASRTSPCCYHQNDGSKEKRDQDKIEVSVEPSMALLETIPLLLKALERVNIPLLPLRWFPVHRLPLPWMWRLKVRAHKHSGVG
jgi:hypothetical protein